MPKKILVIDDDAMNLKMADYILHREGYEVLCASSGAIGIQMLKQNLIDLVLLDIDMPQMNGIETLEMIRKDTNLIDTKVVFLTASGFKEDVTNAVRLGALDFIKKPFLPDELIGRIENALYRDSKDTLLVVDDDSMNLTLAKKLLGIRYRVDCVSSGRAALSYLQNSTPNLILLDLHMPDMNGLEVLQEIQKNEDFDVPIIFLTADNDRETEVKIFKAGAMDYITKPFVPEIVIQRINRILELHHLKASLKEEVTKKTHELMESNRKVTNLSTEVMMALTSAIDAKDRYTKGHSLRVAKYSREIARRMGKSSEEISDVFYAALLHDVGKIGIPDAVINKPGKLTDEEYAVIKTHPVIGTKILNNISEIPTIRTGAHWHHERYDGKGYPDGLKGDIIPEVARIIGVADAYDAMSSKRSYRDVLPQQFIRNEMEKGRGTQFDPEIADIMIGMIDEDNEYNMREM